MYPGILKNNVYFETYGGILCSRALYHQCSIPSCILHHKPLNLVWRGGAIVDCYHTDRYLFFSLSSLSLFFDFWPNIQKKGDIIFFSEFFENVWFMVT